MKKTVRFIFLSVIPMLLIFIWIGSCGVVRYSTNDAVVAHSAFSICKWMYFLVFIYIPISIILRNSKSPNEKLLDNSTASQKKPKNSPTLKILGFIIVMIFILFFSVYTIPGYLAYTERNDSVSNKALRHAYDVAQKYFEKKPDKEITVELLKKFGFLPPDDINLTIVNGEKDELVMILHRNKINRKYRINANGKIDYPLN